MAQRRSRASSSPAAAILQSGNLPQQRKERTCQMKLNEKTVLITGSTDGVGRYVATRLAAAGAQVLIHGRDGKRAAAFIEEIKRAGGTPPTFY